MGRVIAIVVLVFALAVFSDSMGGPGPTDVVSGIADGVRAIWSEVKTGATT